MKTSKMLVVYYSWSNGNTRKIAEHLAAEKNADTARITTVKSCEGSCSEVVDQDQREVEAGYKPEINPLDRDLSDYDVIAVGTPTWWYTMAPAVKTFLEDNDFSGKTVIPFMTNGGWPGHVVKDMTAALKKNGASVVHPMEIQFDSSGGSTQVTPQSEVDEWIQSIG